MALWIFPLLISTFGYAQTVYTTNNSGNVNWSSISWTSTGTGTPETWIIPSGLTAVINSNTTLTDTLRVLGVLEFRSNVTLTMATNGYIELSSGGKVTGGSGNSNIIFGTTGSFTGPWNGSGVNSGPSFAHRTTNGFVTGSAVPVTWSSFTVETNDLFNTLKWSTASELNNSHFEIERSAGEDCFESIGEISGSGTKQSLSHYSFTDHYPPTMTTYYRIKQVDFNGEFDYSVIIKAKSPLKNSVIKVSPNFLSQQEKDLYISNVTENTQYYLINSIGKEVEIRTSFTGPNMVKATIVNSDFKGFLYLYVIDNNNVKTFKLVVH